MALERGDRILLATAALAAAAFAIWFGVESDRSPRPAPHRGTSAAPTAVASIALDPTAAHDAHVTEPAMPQPATPDPPAPDPLDQAPVGPLGWLEELAELKERDLVLPVEGVERDRSGRQLRRAARRRPPPRGDRHPRAAQHPGAGGGGRHHRQAVRERPRRTHDLPVRSRATVLLLLRPPRALRPGSRGRRPRSGAARSSDTSAPRATLRPTHPTCTSPSIGSVPTGAGGRESLSTRTRCCATPSETWPRAAERLTRRTARAFRPSPARRASKRPSWSG